MNGAMPSCFDGVDLAEVGPERDRYVFHELPPTAAEGDAMMDEHAKKLCEELETLRQAGMKVQDDQVLSSNLATRQAEIIEQLKLVGIDPSTLEPADRGDLEGTKS